MILALVEDGYTEAALREFRDDLGKLEVSLKTMESKFPESIEALRAEFDDSVQQYISELKTTYHKRMQREMREHDDFLDLSRDAADREVSGLRSEVQSMAEGLQEIQEEHDTNHTKLKDVLARTVDANQGQKAKIESLTKSLREATLRHDEDGRMQEADRVKHKEDLDDIKAELERKTEELQSII